MTRYINIDDFKEFLPEHLVASFDGYFEENKLQMYKDVRIDENGKETVRGYRFGEPWVAMALYTEGGFKTEKEAERQLRRESIKMNEQLFGLGGMDCYVGYTFKQPKIKKVIYNDPATIVLWNDGTKTVVKCMEGDTFSQEMGLAMCICKKALGDDFHKTFHEWVDYG